MNSVLNKTIYSFSHLLEKRYNPHVVKLPPLNLRLMGERFYDDRYYFQSSLAEGDRFVNKLHVDADSEILEIGCSSGRSVIGLIERAGRVKRYVGVDAKQANVRWCNQYIASRANFCRFNHLDLYSELYNPFGTVKIDENFRLNFDSESFDIIYIQSVLPNYYDWELKIFAKEFHRLLKPNGTLFLTSFVEDNVPPQTENPDNYVMICKYPRQIIRYEKNFFTDLFVQAGFSLSLFEFHMEVDTQSAFYFKKQALSEIESKISGYSYTDQSAISA